MQKYKVIREHLGDRMYVPGEVRELDEVEAGHLVPRCLEPMGAKVETAPKNKMEPDPKNKAPGDLRDDGPTVEEYVAAGYPATKYPPSGYASRSTPEEIAAAVAAQAAKAKPKPRNYADMTVADLRALAETDGVDLGEAKLKADIVAVFEARRHERPDDPEAGK